MKSKKFIILLILCLATISIGCQKQPATIPATKVGTLVPAEVGPTKTNSEILLSPTSKATTTPMFPQVSPSPSVLILTPTPESIAPRFDIITLTNLNQFEKLSETKVYYNSDVSGWYQLIFKPDTEWYVEAGTHIMDLKTGQTVIELSSEEGEYGDSIVSPDGRFLALVAPRIHQVSLWDMTTFQKVKAFPYPASSPLEINGVFSKDNQYLAVAGCRLKLKDDEFCRSSTVMVYNIDTGETALELDGYQTAVTGLAFSPDNRLLFMSGDGENIRNADLLVWDVEKNQRQFEATLDGENWFTGLALSDDGNTLAATSFSDEILHLWNVRTWEESNKISVDGIIGDPVFLPGTGIFLFPDSGGNLRAGTSSEGLLAMVDVELWVARIFVSPDGRFVYLLDPSGALQKWGVARE